MARRDRDIKKGKKVFVRRPHSGFLYRWAPEDEIPKRKKPAVTPKTLGCNATPSSQGTDDIVTYVYDVLNTNGVLSRLAYVACDYVE